HHHRTGPGRTHRTAASLAQLHHTRREPADHHGGAMKLPPEKYQRSLLVELHRRDVPGPRIGDILAEVDSHVAETGETPNDAFGPPKKYAATIAGQRLQRGNRTLRIILLAVSGAATGFLLATAIAGLVAGESRYGVPSWLPLVIGVLLAGLTMALTRR